MLQNLCLKYQHFEYEFLIIKGPPPPSETFSKIYIFLRQQSSLMLRVLHSSTQSVLFELSEAVDNCVQAKQDETSAQIQLKI